MRKPISVVLLLVIAFALLTGCGGGDSSAFDASKNISVVSREDGSGTRGAFIELFGIEVRGEDGSRKDMTTKEAVIANQTGIIMANIAGDKYGIGYVSLGSLNETVKAVQIEGVEATAENIKNGTYPIARPFNIATRGEPTGLAKDFIDFILSADGQAVVAKSYIAVNESTAAYSGSKPSGKLVIGGSSSVTPIMEKLKEAYLEINPNATIEIHETDSTSGMKAAMEGTYDIGMASRELKDSELAELTPLQIALDGIVVVVHKDNPITNLTKEQVKSIYTGETVKWGEV